MKDKQALTLDRLLPRLKAHVARKKKSKWTEIKPRIEKEFPALFHYLYSLYGDHYDFFYHLEEILKATLDAYNIRSDDLRKLDKKRVKNPLWYQDHKQVGAVGYADLFADDIPSLEKRIPYLKELNVTYFHLMPFFDCPDGHNDGGYAVSDYRTVRKDLGTMNDLVNFAEKLRKENISLCADFVFNHTSDEHTWAKRAKQGDEKYQQFYHMFDDRTLPNQYDQTLREIFPDVRRGNFTWVEEIEKWVWTTFHNYQWDLNYKNPELFRHILDEMLYLANQGIEIFRLDAIAFTGKTLGTTSENQPEAHKLVRALNALTNIAAPAVIFKSEAIVHPDYVNSYISEEECETSYNPLLMALMWEALATRDVKLLKHSIKNRFKIPQNTAWVNYVRSHDDIGWTFSDEDAAEVGIIGYDHRQFLNQFYAGNYPGSFSNGVAFQHNPDTGDMRICGMAASLTGMEKAIQNDDSIEQEYSIQRMTLMYGISMFIGGIPLIYLGDELGLLNDYSYRNHPEKKGDSRWVHRVSVDKETLQKRKKPGTVESKMFSNISRLIKLRIAEPVFGSSETIIRDLQNRHLFCFERSKNGSKILYIGNFSEHKTTVSGYLVMKILNCDPDETLKELWSEQSLSLTENLHIEPYQFLVLKLERVSEN